MPLYDYKCTNCGRTYEIKHGFDQAHTEACPECGAPLARVFNAAPIVFKGSGFYVTDSRKSSAGGSSKPAESSSDAKPATAKTDAPAKDAAAPKADAPKASEPAA